MANDVIDFKKKLESKNFITEMKADLELLERAIVNEPDIATREACINEMSKLLHRIQLIKLCMERGYDAREFLIIPNTEESNGQ